MNTGITLIETHIEIDMTLRGRCVYMISAYHDLYTIHQCENHQSNYDMGIYLLPIYIHIILSHPISQKSTIYVTLYHKPLVKLASDQFGFIVNLETLCSEL